MPRKYGKRLKWIYAKTTDGKRRPACMQGRGADAVYRTKPERGMDIDIGLKIIIRENFDKAQAMMREAFALAMQDMPAEEMERELPTLEGMLELALPRSACRLREQRDGRRLQCRGHAGRRFTPCRQHHADGRMHLCITSHFLSPVQGCFHSFLYSLRPMLPWHPESGAWFRPIQTGHIRPLAGLPHKRCV